jgi:hypothetical protein
VLAAGVCAGEGGDLFDLLIAGVCAGRGGGVFAVLVADVCVGGGGGVCALLVAGVFASGVLVLVIAWSSAGPAVGVVVDVAVRPAVGACGRCGRKSRRCEPWLPRKGRRLVSLFPSGESVVAW